jgi:hypothetical protein
MREKCDKDKHRQGISGKRENFSSIEKERR